MSISAGSAFAEGTLHTLVANGPQDRRINIVILAEGYTSAQEAQFVTNAGSILNSLLSAPPWSEYKTYINGFALFVASNQSGADDPSAAIYRDTYFNSTFDSYGTARLLTIPPNDLNPTYDAGYGKVYSLLANHLPSFDIALILVNDLQYGGSGGGIAVSSLHASASEIVLHELGHSHAALGDEYSSSYPGYPDVEEPNTTKQTVRGLIKWSPWIAPDILIPTPATNAYAGMVGLFEGAHFHSKDWFRPCLDCKMKSLGVPYCPVCAQTMVLANYSLLSPIDSVFPSSPTLTIGAGKAETLHVVPQRPLSHPLSIRWYVDDLPIASAAQAAVFSANNLTVGVHAIKCVVSDTTSLVRVDPLHRLRDSVLWTMTVGGACTCPCQGDPNCDGIVLNVLDIAALVDIAIRQGMASYTGGCPTADSDLDCNGVVNVIDVVLGIDVTFRGANPNLADCNPCT